MDYEGNIIRPPSEADSIILQATVGCSHNRCTFCGAYKGVRFRIKNEETINRDLEFAARYCQRQRRLFLADGDALIIPQPRLTRLFGKIRHTLPWVNRINLYANAKAISMKSVADLMELKELGLNRIYMGLESGHDPTLATINKGVDSGGMIEAARKVRQTGLFLSVTVLLGIAGKALSLDHGRATGRTLTAMAPQQIAVLTLMLLPNTPLYDRELAGDFRLPDRRELLLELKTMVEHIDLDRCQFQANHASNYLPINARFPRDKEAVLAAIDLALHGRTPLTPENRRRL